MVDTMVEKLAWLVLRLVDPMVDTMVVKWVAELVVKWVAWLVVLLVEKMVSYSAVMWVEMWVGGLVEMMGDQMAGQ